MIDTHNSLKNDYEVTGIELDTLVDEAIKQEGVIGARMTGAGFRWMCSKYCENR
jgi:galactokinase